MISTLFFMVFVHFVKTLFEITLLQTNRIWFNPFNNGTILNHPTDSVRSIAWDVIAFNSQTILRFNFCKEKGKRFFKPCPDKHDSVKKKLEKSR